MENMGDSNEQTIIISDLLSFVACKIKIANKDNILRALKQYYSEKDIIEAHRTLLASISNKKSVRALESKNSDPLYVIYKYFEIVPEEELPVFVCKNLNNVPELDIIKSEILDDCIVETIQDEGEDEKGVGVERKLREEQKTMKSQIADIAYVVKQLKDQLENISHINYPKSYDSITQIKKKRKDHTEILPSKKQNYSVDCGRSEDVDSSLKKDNLDFLQSLIDEDGNQSEGDQYESVEVSEIKDFSKFMDPEYDDEQVKESETSFCEVILKEEPEDIEESVDENHPEVQNRDIFLVSPSKAEHIVKHWDEDDSKAVGQKVIYLKNNEGQDLLVEEENSIEITPSYDFLGNFEESDPLSRISFELSNEDDFKGEIELMVDEHKPMALVQERRNTYNCTICNEGFKNQKRLNLHVKSHCIKKSFDCILCDSGFTNKEELRSHFEQCLEVTKKKYNLDAYPCPTCGRLYSQARALKQHSYMHSESRPFACSQCTYRYLTKNSLVSHIKTQHNPLNKFFCPFCENSYISSGFLKNHIRSHTGERPYACKECGYKGSTADLLKRHMLTHGPPKEYKCDLCEFTCLGIGKLSRHKAKEHKRENIFCTICGKEFNNSCVYHRHYMSHVGARPFPCTVCSYAAISKEVLLVHMRTHTGDNIIHCPNCAVPFGTKYSLKRHLKSYCMNRPDLFSTEFIIEGTF